MERYEDQENQRRDNDRTQEQRRNENRGDNQYRNDAGNQQSQNRGDNQYQNDNDERSQNRRDSGNQQGQNRGNSQDLERNWRSMESSYRQQYPNLTDEDVNYRSGEFDDMTQRVARRTNRTRQDVENDIRNWNDR